LKEGKEDVLCVSFAKRKKEKKRLEELGGEDGKKVNQDDVRVDSDVGKAVSAVASIIERGCRGMCVSAFLHSILQPPPSRSQKQITISELS